jgi:hypothetical protein
MKKTKFYIGLALVIQSFAALASFFVFLIKKKNVLAAISATLGLISGLAGSYMLYECKTEKSLKDVEEEPGESISDSALEDDVDIDSKEFFERND